MFCHNCGTQINENQSNCTNCGALLNPQNASLQPQHELSYATEKTQEKEKIQGITGLAVTSMVLGIVSLVLFCVAWLAIICAIIGACLGGVALSKAKRAGIKSGMAVAGIVCSVIALGLLIVYVILAATILIGVSTEFWRMPL